MRQFLTVVESPTETAMFDSLRSRGRLNAQFVVQAPRGGTLRIPLGITGMTAGYNSDRWHLESYIWRSQASEELIELVELTVPDLPGDWRMVRVGGDFIQDGDGNFLELKESHS